MKFLRALGVRVCFVFIAVAALAGSPVRAATEIQFWHAMDAALGEQLKVIVSQFNAGQKDYIVVPVYKGSYDDTFAAGIAASLAGKAPHILQVYEVGTANMMSAKRVTKPLPYALGRLTARAARVLQR